MNFIQLTSAWNGSSMWVNMARIIYITREGDGIGKGFTRLMDTTANVDDDRNLPACRVLETPAEIAAKLNVSCPIPMEVKP